ncbi:MAG: acyltransferase [Solirubrobacteraceae bacterium]
MLDRSLDDHAHSGFVNTALRAAARRALRPVRGWGERIIRESINCLASSPAVPNVVRCAALRLYGLHVGTCRIEPGSWFGGPHITIGDDSYINRGCVFDNSASIAIGRSCSIGMNVLIITSDHAIGPSHRRAGTLSAAAITIGDGAWIGTRVTLLPGSAVAAGCVVAAGSVIRGKCEADGLYAGIPARRVRDLP